MLPACGHDLGPRIPSAGMVRDGLIVESRDYPTAPPSPALALAGRLYRAELADPLRGGQDEQPDRGRVPARPVLQRAQEVPVGVGAPQGARPAERDNDAEQARGLRDRLGGDVADVANYRRVRPIGAVACGQTPGRNGALACQADRLGWQQTGNYRSLTD